MDTAVGNTPIGPSPGPPGVVTGETELTPHERHVEKIAAAVISKLDSMKPKGDSIMEGGETVKNIFQSGPGDNGSRAGDNGIAAAAIMAAAMNNNRGNDNGVAMLAAALANRRDDNTPAYLAAMNRNNTSDAMIPAFLPFLANRDRHDNDGMFGGDLGAGFFGGIIAGALFGGGRRHGFLGGGDDCGNGGGETRVQDNIFNTAVLTKLGSVEAAIPAAACDIKSSICEAEANLTNVTLQQTIAIERDLGQLALGVQQGFANNKDALQNSLLGIQALINNVNQNVSEQGCATRAAVNTDGDRTRALLVARFQLEDSTRITELNTRLAELENDGRRRRDHDELRLQITNTNTAVAAQQQGQAQAQAQRQGEVLASLVPLVHGLVSEIQIARATNANFVIGNTGAVATGPQTANPVNVRG